MIYTTFGGKHAVTEFVEVRKLSLFRALSENTYLTSFKFFFFFNYVVVVVQSLNRVQLFVTPWTAARQASLSFTISWSLLKLTSIELVMPSNLLILCHPLLLLTSTTGPVQNEVMDHGCICTSFLSLAWL